MGKAEWVLGGVLLCAVIAALVSGHSSGPPDNWLYHYQTLIIGALTVLAAIVAAVLLHRQTRQAADTAQDVKDGQRQAARSWLSLHLSSIIGYSRETGSGIWDIIRESQSPLNPYAPLTVEPKFPEIPMEAAIAVKEFAAYATPDEAKTIAYMLSTMQVLNARVERVRSDDRFGRIPSHLEGSLELSAELYARGEALLDYARHTTSIFPIGVTWKDYSQAFYIICRTYSPTTSIARKISEGSKDNPQALIPNRFDRRR